MENAKLNDVATSNLATTVLENENYEPPRKRAVSIQWATTTSHETMQGDESLQPVNFGDDYGQPPLQQSQPQAPSQLQSYSQHQQQPVHFSPNSESISRKLSSASVSSNSLHSEYSIENDSVSGNGGGSSFHMGSGGSPGPVRKSSMGSTSSGGTGAAVGGDTQMSPAASAYAINPNHNPTERSSSI